MIQIFSLCDISQEQSKELYQWFIDRNLMKQLSEYHYYKQDIDAVEHAQAFVTNLPDNLRGKISDGYHTIDELYEHRCQLWMVSCALYQNRVNESPYREGRHMGRVWRSKFHSDGSVFEGWFILGISLPAVRNTQGVEVVPARQLTYHLPERLWEYCFFADTPVFAPPFDGHTSNDVLQNLKLLVPAMPQGQQL